MDNFGETQGNILVIVYVCIYEVAWFILKINYGATRRKSSLKIFKRLGVPPISYYLINPLLLLLLLLFVPN
jgi:purine-cytosine permease-like protein